ncbi:MAG: VOC family protein [Gammaproteobacteria bacterium]
MAAKKSKKTPKKKSGTKSGKKSGKKPGKKSGKKKAPARKARAAAGADVPSFFRLTVEVGNLDLAEEFYNKLFDTKGLRSPGARVYIQAGPVALQVVDVSASGAPHPAAKSLYFTVKGLEPVHYRATLLGALSEELVHGHPGGEIAKRPWGERSFYAEDPWGNPLCFVEAS